MEVNAIHIVFDNPGRLSDHPKRIEHQHRDSGLIGHQSHSTFEGNIKAHADGVI